MPEVTDTPVEGETVTPEVNGTEVGAPTEAVIPEVTPVAPDPAEVEKLRKELNQAQMEINQRRNKEKELEAARAAAERERIEKESDAQVQAEFYRKQLEEREAADAEREKQAEADRQAREVEEFRDKIIAEYPTEIQNLAKQLGTNWDDAADYGTAETQLRAKLDLLKGAVTISAPEEDAPEISPNNPASMPDTELDKLAKLSAKEMRKLLPVATPR